ncbi:cis-3-hydroxy-L-proline dehydratase [Gellertiella hungarica]|uniref:DUF521 domain-containing protein n=1 Tax=Gellertiella hungarica TaxID=1572859 RepID=A0A7W6J6U0_9HYPH|nr:aconitase X [Gellertiella hungarica]MBB4065787.1 hypothetical protein [Gellertiella hungarica]
MADRAEGTRLAARILVEGTAEGRVLRSDMPISFWGGVDAFTGVVIDRNHPLFGESIAGRILAIPGGRGSCTGSSVLMELLLNGHGPAALIFSQPEEILTLGVIVAEEMFGTSIPVLQLHADAFAQLRPGDSASIAEGVLHLARAPADFWGSGDHPPPPAPDVTPEFSEADRGLLEGKEGAAAAMAMRIIRRMAVLQGAPRLIDVSRAHIDGCIYTGAASLRFAETLAGLGGRVRVPTTLNAISVDQRRWTEHGTDPALARPASALADAYVAMGAQPSFTCAPYLLDAVPTTGDDIAWAESNAVVFANSVLGARTVKYPDYMDLCIALTGRAPLAGPHRRENRKVALRIVLPFPAGADDSFWPLAGYRVGLLSPAAIPLVEGLEEARPSADDLKAFSAAFGTTSGAPMFHMAGVTPEAALEQSSADGLARILVSLEDLQASWRALNRAEETRIDLVALGNPHFSITEFEALAKLVEGRERRPDVAVVVTTGRATEAAMKRRGLADPLARFGVRVVTDACWCTVSEPVVPPAARTILTNSGKYAHYGPGLSGRGLRFAALADCVEAATTGYSRNGPPAWLAG